MCKSSSLSRCLMMSYCVSHRCLTIVMQRMCCQRSTLRVGSSCYISGVMGHPKNASGRHCILSLCHLMYCHLPNISLWRLRKFTKPQSHLQQIPISFQKGTPWECGFSLHSATTDTAHLCNHCICDDSLTALQPLTISAWFFCNG